MDTLADCRKNAYSTGYFKIKEEVHKIELKEEDEGGLISLCVNSIEMGDFDDLGEVYEFIKKVIL